MKDVIKLLRYNTGTDKKAFIKFKGNFDAVLFNATIVAYSGTSIADLVTLYQNKFIIDPQTHILQQEYSSITTKSKKQGIDIKASVKKYFECLPQELTNVIANEKRPLTSDEISNSLDSLVNNVVDFQNTYVSKKAIKQDYEKYLKFVHKDKQAPRFIIAPYFMIKKDYINEISSKWINLNELSIQKTIKYCRDQGIDIPVAAQLVIDQEILKQENIIYKIAEIYKNLSFDYIFVWIDDFNSFQAGREYSEGFSYLIKLLNSNGKKPIMAYGGYESIILCNEKSPCRLYGVAQSVGYGEQRAVTPVGGGMPVNKYYFLPIHVRLRFDEAFKILHSQNYFSDTESVSEHANEYYKNICDCNKCKEIIDQDINNFDKYNDSKPFIIHTKKRGNISRNRPTTDATLSAAIHFLYCKITEWNKIEKDSFEELITDLCENYKTYCPDKLSNIMEWRDIFGQE